VISSLHVLRSHPQLHICLRQLSCCAESLTILEQSNDFTKRSISHIIPRSIGMRNDWTIERLREILKTYLRLSLMTDQGSRHPMEIEEMSFARPLFLNNTVPHDPSTTCRNRRSRELFCLTFSDPISFTTIRCNDYYVTNDIGHWKFLHIFYNFYIRILI